MWPFTKKALPAVPKYPQYSDAVKALESAKKDYCDAAGRYHRAEKLYIRATEVNQASANSAADSVSRMVQDSVELACDNQKLIDAVTTFFGIEVVVNGPEEVEVRITDRARYKIAGGEAETKVKLWVDEQRLEELVRRAQTELQAFRRRNL